MRLQRLLLAGVLGTGVLGGCTRDDAAVHEPNANEQKVIPDKGYPSDSPYGRDQKDQKATEQDEATSKN